MSLPYCLGAAVIKANLSVSPIYLFPIPLLPTWCKHFSVHICSDVCVLIENKLLLFLPTNVKKCLVSSYNSAGSFVYMDE